MINIANQSESRPVFRGSYHARHQRKYDFQFDQISRLPIQFEISMAPFLTSENYIIFNYTDTVNLIHGIVDSANKKTCEMLIHNLKHRLNEIDNDESSKTTTNRS